MEEETESICTNGPGEADAEAEGRIRLRYRTGGGEAGSDAAENVGKGFSYMEERYSHVCTSKEAAAYSGGPRPRAEDVNRYPREQKLGGAIYDSTPYRG